MKTDRFDLIEAGFRKFSHGAFGVIGLERLGLWGQFEIIYLFEMQLLKLTFLNNRTKGAWY